MKNKIKQVKKIIGHTPLIKVDIGIADIKVLAKLETHNLTGSIKDRMAIYMIQQAQKKGLLKPGHTMIEATTGNTGISLAALSSALGYKMIAIMPEDVSRERVKMIKAYGVKVILTLKKSSPKGAIDRKNKLLANTKNSWSPDQFNNPDNIKAHESGIAQEILIQTQGNIDYFVHGIGTGGTFIGIAKTLKDNIPNIKTIAVEPSESAVLSGSKPGHHGIQGIGEGFIPSLVDKKLIDFVISVSTKEAIIETKNLAKKNGLLVGFSSGANIVAIKKIVKTINKPATTVTIFADRGERYLSVL